MATDDVRCFFDISIGGQHGTPPEPCHLISFAN
jgi:hypothetical protein